MQVCNPPEICHAHSQHPPHSTVPLEKPLVQRDLRTTTCVCTGSNILDLKLYPKGQSLTCHRCPDFNSTKPVVKVYMVVEIKDDLLTEWIFLPTALKYSLTFTYFWGTEERKYWSIYKVWLMNQLLSIKILGICMHRKSIHMFSFCWKIRGHS